MSYPEWINEHGIPYQFIPYDTRRFRGNLLNGSVAFRADVSGADLLKQEWASGLYQVGFYMLHFPAKQVVEVQESRDMTRLEAVISGELKLLPVMGKPVSIRQGQYHISGVHHYKATFAANSGCHYFTFYYSEALLKDFGISGEILHCLPRNMPERMLQLLQQALHQPHSGSVADIFYRKLVAEILFIHLTSAKLLLPGELSEKDIAAIYQADAILAKDLSEHYTILKLSGMAGTNAFKLKRGFRLIFKMGVFARLIYRRMEHGKMLLETTSLAVKEVAFESGYSTVGGFIHAFRKRFKMTPLEWRENKGGVR